jgi:hypothetical protein
VSGTARLVALREGPPPTPIRVGDDPLAIGREPGSDLVLESERVSRRHARIEPQGAGHAIVDLGAANGTRLNGRRVRGRAALRDGDVIDFAGAESFRYETAEEEDPAAAPRAPRAPRRRPPAAWIAALVAVAVAAAVVGALEVRRRNLERQAYEPAVERIRMGLRNRDASPDVARQHFKAAIGLLYRRGLLDEAPDGAVFDEGLRILEARLERPADLRAIYRSLQEQTAGPAPGEHPPCRLDRTGAAELPACLRSAVAWLLLELHQSDTDVPEEFVRQVGRTLLAEHAFLARAIPRGVPLVPMMRRELEQKKMPHLLHYVAAIESGYRSEARSGAGALGLWQFMPGTAADYGLVVSGAVDERTDPEKSTRAAAHYLQHLVFEFGSDALLLALAGYNYGQARVRVQLKKLDDPFHDRSYWRLVERGLLPAETAAYVARYTAAALVGESGLPEESALRAAGY